MIGMVFFPKFSDRLVFKGENVTKDGFSGQFFRIFGISSALLLLYMT